MVNQSPSVEKVAICERARKGVRLCVLLHYSLTNRKKYNLFYNMKGQIIMADLNQVILLGRLTAEPELTQTPSGDFVCRFTIASNRLPNKEGVQKADYIKIVVWRKTAELVAKKFRKGKPILIQGSLKSGNFKNKKDGKLTYYTEVEAQHVFFAGKSKAEQEETQSSDFDLSDFEEVVGNSDLPF